MTDIYIEVQGGLVQNVYSTDNNVNIHVCDYDIFAEGTEEEINERQHEFDEMETKIQAKQIVNVW